MRNFDAQQNYYIDVQDLHDVLAALGAQEDKDGNDVIVTDYILIPNENDKKILAPEHITELQLLVTKLNNLHAEIRKLDAQLHDVTEQYC